MRLYSLFDTVTGTFAPPIQAVDDVSASRMVVSFVKRDPNSVVSRYLRDYELRYLGDFDDSTGRLTPVPGHEPRIDSLYNIITAYDRAVKEAEA